ncbi:RNA polymerase factor sigma-54 [Legionella septentrionalis]|uniref:RNA polymerase sigma-54 factor n=1 Tax=Legionella septentrionalis TaxID=2498109 RepID=A0A433JLS4_9GAMM|nr:RNA polymerase factor sigma-54 [Legionella septentrionalis]RUQ90777.1 RNA polymerase factor sigma-54 [Legionella septentrionalis]
MKHSLQLNLVNQLTLTPQLQQAIRLLQLSTLELQQEIQQQLESNPMLEAAPNEETEDYSSAAPPSAEEDYMDFQWTPLFTNQGKDKKFNENDYVFETLHCTTTNLQEYLHWQLDLTPMTDVDKAIATTIIDAINEDGFLTLSLQELHATITRDLPNSKVDTREMEAVLHRIQRFDPIGCAARNLSETLSIQLEQLPDSIPYLPFAKRLVAENLDLLGQHNYRKLMAIYGVDELSLQKIIHIIHQLNPKPGNTISRDTPQYTIPDLTVKKIDNKWHVALNDQVLPHLSINTYYASLIKRGNNAKDNQFLKNNLQEARWFLKSIQSRQETLLKVARYIVDYQQEFLEFGETAMKPLILNDVAFALGMHESTISRVTTQKYIYTPRGLLELKYFFSSHVSTAQGGTCSSTAIRALIKKLILAEDSKHPLSDHKLAQLIGAQGIKIARRTVAKYREELGILSSNERKSVS